MLIRVPSRIAYASARDPGHDLLQRVSCGGEQIDAFPQVPPDGADPDTEADGHPGEGVAVAEVGQDQQRLPVGRRLAPP